MSTNANAANVINIHLKEIFNIGDLEPYLFYEVYKNAVGYGQT